jgi:subtilisin family serine protease
MLKIRTLWVLGLALVVGPFTVMTQELGIELGGHWVHPTRIIARYQDPAGAVAPQNLSLLSSLGVRVTREYPMVPGLVTIDEPSSALALQAVGVFDPDFQARQLTDRIGALRRSGLFRYVEPDYVRKLLRDPNDQAYLDGVLWGLRNDGGGGGVVGADISAREAWDLTIGSTNVIVAVTDSGIRYTHQDLRAQMWRNPGETGLDDEGNDRATNGIDDDGNGVIDDVFGIDAFDVDNMTGDPMDFDDHGTHVAGTIGAAANDGNPHVGVSWQVQLMALRFLSSAGGFSSGAIATIQYATTNGASIINASWGGGPFSSGEFDAIAAARDAGVLFVAAAGNDAMDTDETADYPSTYDLDNIISVAALTRADRLASFSNYGATTVDLGAPGQEIYSTISISDAAYDTFSGTSMAAPHVSGVAALIRARFPTLHLLELRERLLKTVVPIPALDGLTVTGGRVNAYKALIAEGDGELEMSVTPPSYTVLLAGSTQQVFVAVTDLFAITNATVTGRFILGSDEELSFVNDGTAPDTQANDLIYSAEFEVPIGISELQLELIALAEGFVGVTNVVHWHVAEPPTNDDFENAHKIDGDSVLIYSNSRFATMQFPDEPLHAGVPTVSATLWWVWSPGFDNQVLIDTAGTEFDTVVAVYTNRPLASVREIVSANDSDGRRQAYVQFQAKRGLTYYIVVGGATASDTGSIRLRLEADGLPDTLPPIVAFTDPPNGSIVTTDRIEVRGLAADPHPGSGVAQVFIRANDDLISRQARGTTNWTVSLLLRPGYNRVFATAADFVRNLSDPVRLDVEYMPPGVPNDHFVNALVLEGTEGLVGAGNHSATREFGEPFHGGNEGGHSIWYRWTAPADGVLTLLTTNVAYDTLIGVYTGDRVNELTTVGGNDDHIPGGRYSRVEVGVIEGVVYSIAVDGFAASVGDADLAYSFVPAGLVRLEVAAGSNGRVREASGHYEQGSIVRLEAYPDLGFAFAGWEGTIVSSDNPFDLVMDQDHTLTARFQSAAFTDGFETGGFSSELGYSLTPPGSQAAWFVQSASVAAGQYAARTGRIGPNQVSALKLVEDMVAGVASFAYRVSTEANFDVVDFYVNGQLKQSWSGLGDWSSYQFVVPAGLNTFEWRYRKDSSINDGEDAFFLDNLTIPRAIGIDPSWVRLQMLEGPAGTSLALKGITGRQYLIEASSDMKTWQTVTIRTADNGIIELPNAILPAPMTRFYRAREY